jgi:catechol 2,3-dioxygenase-like lactoylglutathione lyase family enzyme
MWWWAFFPVETSILPNCRVSLQQAGRESEWQQLPDDGLKHRRNLMGGVVGAHHTSFTVADIDRSIAFFRDQLGFELQYTRQVRDEYFARIVGIPDCVVLAALLRIPGTTHHVELFEYQVPRGVVYNPQPCDPGSSHLSLLVDDLPALYDRLCAAGVEFVSRPVLVDAGPNCGGCGVYLRDPNGILIELFQPPPQAD